MPDLPESSRWPLCRIEAIDPYPFHGLVYRLLGGGDELIDPGDGREPFVRAEVTFNSPYLMPIGPERDAALWDIGKPDPPPGEVITEAGGTSLGRRLVAVGDTMPTRLNDRTYQLQVSALRVTGGTQMVLGLKGEVAEEFDFIPDSAFGLNLSGLYTENGVSISESAVADITLQPQHVTPDGTRRLFIARVAPVTPSSAWVETPIGFVEVVVSQDEEGEIQAVASVIKGAAECLGTFTAGGTNDVKRSRAVDGGAPCEVVYELVPQDFPFVGVAGSTHRATARSGLVTGALYVDGVVRYFTLDVETEYSESATFSRSGYTGVPDFDEEGGYTCDFDGVDTSPPISRTNSLTITESMTMHFNGHSVTAGRTYNQEASGTEDPGTPGSLTGTFSWTSVLAGSTASASSDLSSMALMNLGWVFEGGPPGGAQVMPTVAELRESSFRLVRFQAMRTYQGFAVLLSDEFDGRQSPMLHPGGVHGEWEDITPIRTELAVPLYDAAYNPITDQAIRACDLPGDHVLIGWL